MDEVILHEGRDRSLRRRHPWVLSGAVAEVRGGGEPGAEVCVRSAAGEPLGYGHLSPTSPLRIRIHTFGKEPPGDAWLAERLRAAVAHRAGHPLLADTDALRLVNAEGDGLPGLVVDRYADTVVVRIGAPGMQRRRDSIGRALRTATGAACGFERADAAAGRREGFAPTEGALWGELPDAAVPIVERGRRFEVDVRAGQKTGFYLDQRDARDLVERLAAGARVLDLFTYTGGFAVAAARGGARRVVGVDSSEGALVRARAHVDRSGSDCEVELRQGDAFQVLRGADERFDLIVLDPPPLARRRADLTRATRAYKDLWLNALRRVEPGGRVLGFSCSHHVGADLLRKVVFGASLDARRPARVVAELGAPADHPVSLDHPEGAYLSGLLLEV